MPKSIDIQILEKIKKARRGSLFFSEDFINKGHADAVRKALERLVKAGELQRVARGIYVRPEKDPVLGYVTPDIEKIVKAIAKRDRARIVPTGTYALNRLGLSTQVPMNVLYLTDGSARKIKIGKYTVNFKRTTPKNLAARGEISKLVIQALRTIGKDNATKEEIKRIRQLLKKEKPTHFQHDIRLAPAWIRKIMLPVIEQKINE